MNYGFDVRDLPAPLIRDEPALDAGFTATTTERPWTMTLTHDCGEHTTFWNPTAERVVWYQRSHRCGDAIWQHHPPP